MSRYNERKNAMIAVYMFLLNQQSMAEIIEDNIFIASVSEFIEPFDLKDEMLEAVSRVETRFDIYVRAMDQTLDKWRFERLGYIEQAILLLACAELEMGYQDRVIIVNEAIRLSKEFCDYDSFKLVNGVLDAI